MSLSSLREKKLFLKVSELFKCKLLLVGQNTFSVNKREIFWFLKKRYYFYMECARIEGFLMLQYCL